MLFMWLNGTISNIPMFDKVNHPQSFHRQLYTAILTILYLFQGRPTSYQVEKN